MPTIVERRLSNKKKEVADITKQIEAEQISASKTEKESISDIVKTISRQFFNELNNTEVDKEELDEKIKQVIYKEIEKLPNKTIQEKKRLEKLAIENIIGLGPLQQYLDNPEVTEIIVQKYNNICVEINGKIMAVSTVFSDETALRNVISRILQPVGREVNISTPIVDAYLEDGSRICATIPPASPKGATLTIRKFNNKMMTPEKYIELRSLDSTILNFLKLCVIGKVSIFVSGGTGTGKTTFLNMLSGFLPKKELIITIEDTLELQLHQKNVRSLETRPIASGNASMQTIDMSALVKASLRMRPDRIIVGETRDGAVVSLLSAMSTGHEGSMSTGHANSPENLVNVRIPTMIEMDKDTSYSERAQALMIAEAIQLIVQLRRLPGGRRVVSEIAEIKGIGPDGRVELEDIFVYDFAEDKFKFTGYYPEKIIEHAFCHGIIIDKNIFV